MANHLILKTFNPIHYSFLQAQFASLILNSNPHYQTKNKATFLFDATNIL